MTSSVTTEAAPADLRKAKRQKVYSDPVALDRLPPHDVEAEQGVLGCVMLSPDQCLTQCIEVFAGAQVFYDLRHQIIYETMLEMFDDREAIDVITLQYRLKKKSLLEQCGGIPALNALMDAVPSAANVSYYAGIVWEKYQLRSLLGVCTDVAGRVYEHAGKVDALLDEVERDVLKICAPQSTASATTIKELVKAALVKMEDAHAGTGARGLSTGFADLDKLTAGLHPAQMVVIAARPSVGKTSLAMNIAEHVACDCGLPVGVFSLEMTAADLVLRMICGRARVDGMKVRDGYITGGDFTSIGLAAPKIAAAPLYIDDTAGLNISHIRAKARRWHQLHGIRLLVVDYLQLVHATVRKSDNRQNEVTAVSGGLKELAKELSIPVIVLCQLNRDCEKGGKGGKPRPPRASDLRESGSIEQDADFVGLLYRTEEPDEDNPGSPYAVKLFIDKQRNGPRYVTVDLNYLPTHTRFESAAKVAREDMP